MKTFFSLLLITVSTAAIAAETPRIDTRQDNQAKRIEQGVESGQLNEKEAERLNRQQARTEALEEKAKADGEVSKKERARLKHRENKTNRHIAKQKHDRQHQR